MQNLVLAIFFLFALSTSAFASITKGFNQAWFKDSYAHQWLDGHYDAKEAKRILVLNKEAGSQMLRMWLYEGMDLSQFEYDKVAQTIKLREGFLKNLGHFLTLARKHKTKINLTFLDANAFKNVSQNPELLNFWWNVFNDKYGKLDHFHKEAILPVYQLIEKKFKDVVTQIDIANEVNALNHFRMFQTPKNSLSHFLCKMTEQKPTAVTASLGWGKAELQFFSGLLDSSCLDFFDIHFYNDTGEVPGCSQFLKYARKGYHLQLGEFGQFSKAYDNNLQSSVTQKFLANAEKCGFESALAWRLDDSRNGNNPEARHSYFSFGMVRPAYYVLRDYMAPF